MTAPNLNAAPTLDVCMTLVWPASVQVYMYYRIFASTAHGPSVLGKLFILITLDRGNWLLVRSLGMQCLALSETAGAVYLPTTTSEKITRSSPHSAR